MQIEKLTLDAKDLSKLLGISKGSCYKLFRRSDFPTITIGKRKLVACDKLYAWLNAQTQQEADRHERTQ